MKALHLNYHDVLNDPRVLKQCISLSEKGIDVSVICSDADNLDGHQVDQSFSIQRMDWLKTNNLTNEYLDTIDHFPKSKTASLSRLKPIADMNKHRQTLERLFKEVWGNEDLILDHKSYKKLKGIFRHKAKWAYINRNRKLKKLLKLEPYASQLGGFVFDIFDFKKFAAHKLLRAKHGDVYQASSFLFDANVKALNIEGKFDIIHAHDIYTLPAGVNLAKRFGARLIYDAHEYEIERASKMPPEGNHIAQAIEDDCFPYVDAIVTVSQGICDLYAKRFTKRTPELILNAPVVTKVDRNSEEMHRDRCAFRRLLGVDDMAVLVAYTGLVLKEQRGLRQVAEALSLMPAMHLVILGPRDNVNDEILLDAARKLGVLDRIHMLDSVPHTEVVGMVQRCDVSIVPFQDAGLSYRHAMPNKLFEGVFAGLPVAVSNLPDMSKFVKGLGRGKAMDASDPTSIAEIVSDLYNNRDQYSLSSDAYYDLVQNYSWTAQANRLENLYRNLCSTSSIATEAEMQNEPRK